MCSTCGCESNNQVKISKPGIVGHSHDHHEHSHEHSHEHQHGHHHSHEREIQLEIDVLQQNNLMAQRNRGYFEAKNMFVVNLVSSPGSGKTTLLESTAKNLKDLPLYVIEGDQRTMNDSERIDALNIPVVQVNTGHGCHLDSQMIYDALHELKPKNDSVLIIENVGNLVCPSLFDLGETHRVVIMSVTEGEDKPLKYPDIFEGSQLCIINKIDLLPYLELDVEKAKKYARQINPDIDFIELSSSKGTGLNLWTDWLMKHLPQTVI